MMLTVLAAIGQQCQFRHLFRNSRGRSEYLVAPTGWIEVALGFIGAAAAKAVLIALVILLTSFWFNGVHIAHPFWMLAFLVLTAGVFAAGVHHRSVGQEFPSSCRSCR